MDETLLRKLKEGDEEAWSNEFQRTWTIAFSGARLQRLSAEDAEDVAIAAIQELMRCIASTETIETIETIAQLDDRLKTISRRRAIDLIRKRTAVKRPKTISDEQIGPEDEEINLFERIPAGTPSEITALTTSRGEINTIELISHLPDRLCKLDLIELRKILMEVVDQLPEPGRSIWQDRTWQDLSYMDLRKKHGRSLGAIRTLVCRTQAKLCLIIFRSPDYVKRLREFLR
jgi:DNA-directed RNA polymerase specialized sigma24 family protein